MSKTFGSFVCCILMSLEAIGQGPIYDNGMGGGPNNAYTINFDFMVSNSFVVASPVQVTNLAFTAWMYAGSVVQKAEVGITSQPYNGGTRYLDFTLPVTQGACSDTQMYGLSFSICSETVAIPPNINLPSGTYWLSLSHAYAT